MKRRKPRAWALGLAMLGSCLDSGGGAADREASRLGESRAALGESWLATAPMTVGRLGNSATLLPSGKVLIAGGIRVDALLTIERSAELYDPATGSFVATGSMVNPHYGHAAAPLRDGRVLIVGGFASIGLDTEPSQTAEIYDPESGSFHALEEMLDIGVAPTATLLAKGEVLVLGWKQAMLFDPATDAFRPAGPGWDGRIDHAATLLPSGRVLVTGGSIFAIPTESAAEYDRFAGQTGSFAPVGSMARPRTSPAATLLPTGDVLVVGGSTAGAPEEDAEIYHPDTRSFSTAGPTVLPRESPAAVLLPSGKVLVAGGTTGDAAPLAEIFDPQTASWSPVDHPTDACWTLHAATQLPFGRVLVSGGCPSPSAEIFDPEGSGERSSFTPLGAPSIQRARHTATLLPSGKVLIAGGADGGVAQGSAFLLDPAQGGAMSPLASTIGS